MCMLLAFDWLVSSKLDFFRSDADVQSDVRSDIRLSFPRSKDKRRSMFLKTNRKILVPV